MEEKKYKLTYPQNNIYLVEKYAGTTAINTITGIFYIKEKFDINICKKVISNIIKFNDIMRVKIVEEDGNVCQIINEYVEEDIKVVDFSQVNEEELEAYKTNFANTPFNITAEKLYCFEIIKQSENKGAIILRVNHIIADAWSASLLISQLMKEYDALVNKKELEIVERPNYFEYLEKESEYINSDKYQKDKEFWENYLIGIEKSTSLSNNLKSNSYNAKRYVVELDTTKTMEINEFCRENRVSPYVLFLATLAIYAYRIQNNSDILLGTPVLNRSNFKEKNMLGLFISTLPIRIKVQENKSVIEFLKELTLNTLSLFRHQKYPYNEISDFVHKNAEFNDSLYHIMLSYQNARISDITESYSTDWCFQGALSNELQIHITDMDNVGKLTINYDFLEDMFSEVEIKYLNSRLIEIINNIILNKDANIEELNIIDETEKNEILYTNNATRKNYDKETTVISLFENQVKLNPNNIALVVNDKKISYNELNEKANRLARFLVQNNNIKPNDIIAVLMDRDENLIISLLAILKCGAAYLPIDLVYPKERINYMLNIANLVITNTDISSKEIDKSLKVIDISELKINNELDKYSAENLEINIDSKADLINYCIYTSGSTGNPKAISISNQNLLNFVLGINEYVDINLESTFVSITTISFDIFGLEIWGSLTNGAKLVLATEEECINQDKLNKLCIANKVNIIQTTPTKLKMLTSDSTYLDYIQNMNKILIGGEGIPEAFVKFLRSMTESKIYNVYGPSETTIWSTIQDITLGEINAGKPIQNTRLYILDKKGRELPLNIAGELCIAGDSVFKGYYNNVELTKKAIVTGKSYDEVLYKTGDLARIDFNGNVNILGRLDLQVKLNGQRIELKEIENLICRYENIKNAVVILKEDINQLVTFYTLENNEKEIDIENLKKYLYKKLPVYMVPQIYVYLDKFPQTLNNKIDRKELNKMKVVSKKSRTIIMPKTKLQNQIYSIWKKVIPNVEFGIKDKFFELGTDSLDAIKVEIELLSLSIHIDYVDLFKYPTIEELEKKILEKKKETVYSVDGFKKDYSDILESNKNDINVVPRKVKDIMISGVTGYLGIHILEEFLLNESGIAYCLIRKKNDINVRERMIQQLHFYYGDKYDNLLGKRIIPIEADIMDANNFNIDKEVFAQIISNINVFVHSAACVKHYGDERYFFKINVDITKNVAKFCYENNIQLMHISTLSISGTAFEGAVLSRNKLEEKKIFDETCFYQNQNVNNIYIYTKFLAEEVVLDYMKKGLKANIFRLGNLTSSSIDYKFQVNANENAFLNRMKTFLKLGYMPKLDDDMYIEFSPVDEIAKSIIKIMQHFNLEHNVFHLYNNNHVKITRLIEILNIMNKKMQVINNEEFKNKIKEVANSEKRDILNGIINDLDEEFNLDYNINVIIKSDYTNRYLNKLGFSWKEITDEYIINYIKFLEER